MLSKGRKFLIGFLFLLVALLLLAYWGAEYYVRSDSGSARIRELLESQTNLKLEWEDVTFSWKLAPRFRNVILRPGTPNEFPTIKIRRLDIGWKTNEIKIEAGSITLEPWENLPKGGSIRQIEVSIQKSGESWLPVNAIIDEPSFDVHLQTQAESAVTENPIPGIFLFEELPPLPQVALRDGRVQFAFQDKTLALEGITADLRNPEPFNSENNPVIVITANHEGHTIHAELHPNRQPTQLVWLLQIDKGLPGELIPSEFREYLTEFPGIKAKGRLTRIAETIDADVDINFTFPYQGEAGFDGRLIYDEPHEAILSATAQVAGHIPVEMGLPVSGTFLSEIELPEADSDGWRKLSAAFPNLDLSYIHDDQTIHTGPTHLDIFGNVDPSWGIHAMELSLRADSPRLLWQGRTIAPPPIGLRIENLDIDRKVSADRLAFTLGDLLKSQASHIEYATDLIQIKNAQVKLPHIENSLALVAEIYGTTPPVNLQGDLELHAENWKRQDTISGELKITGESLQLVTDEIAIHNGSLETNLALAGQSLEFQLNSKFERSIFGSAQWKEPIALSMDAKSSDFKEQNFEGQWSLNSGSLHGAGRASWNAATGDWSVLVQDSRLNLESTMEQIAGRFLEASNTLIVNASSPPAISGQAKGSNGEIRTASAIVHWDGLEAAFLNTDTFIGIEDTDGHFSFDYQNNDGIDSVAVDALFEHPNLLINEAALDIGGRIRSIAYGFRKPECPVAF